MSKYGHVFVCNVCAEELGKGVCGVCEQPDDEWHTATLYVASTPLTEAAPDMLEALKEAEALLSEYVPSSDLDCIRAAIKKAENTL